MSICPPKRDKMTSNSVIPLIPFHHRQVIVDSFCHKNLMEINDSVVKSGGAGGEVHVPHPHEAVIEHFSHIVNTLSEVFFPAKQCPVVVHAQIFDAQRVKLIF